MSKFVYSYCGYYNDLYLRSSYEYVFCKILEKQKINFKMEQEKYLLPNGKYYIPDFFIYNDKNELIKIIEIKGEAKMLAKKGLENISMLREIVDVECEIYFLNDLFKFERKLKLNIDKLIQEWKDKNSKNRNSIKTKKVKEAIGATTKERMNNPEWKKYWKNQIKESAKNWSYKLEGERTKRTIKECPICKKKFKTIPSKDKTCCSLKCANKYSVNKCNKIKKDKNIIKKDKIKKDFFNGLKYDKDFDLKLYINNFYLKCGFADVRPLSKILIGKYTKNINKLINDIDFSKYMPTSQNDKL